MPEELAEAIADICDGRQHLRQRMARLGRMARSMLEMQTTDQDRRASLAFEAGVDKLIGFVQQVYGGR